MAQALIESTALEDFAGQIGGDVIAPGAPEYDEARSVFNLSLIHI